MKKSGRGFITILFIAIVAFILWKFVIKTSKVTLADNSTIYKKGGNYFLNSNGVEVKISESEYNRLNNYVAGSCTNPNAISTFSVETCDYFSYKGQKNECGDCVLITPITKNCAQIGANCTLPSGKPGKLMLTSSDAKQCYYTCYTIVS